MKKICLIPTAVLLMSSTPVTSLMANPLHLAMAALQPSAEAFVTAPGYAMVDPEILIDDNYYSPQNFPGAEKRTSIFLPDANLDAVTRAILLLEAQETEVPRVRYRVTYSMHHDEDIAEAQQAYVDIRRYNLGPALREELIESIGAQHVASPEIFGVGPHVNWRFVMSPMMGMMADATYASRRELTDKQAQADDCLGESCLSTSDPAGPEVKPTTLSAPQMETPQYRYTTDGVARPAYVAQTLWTSVESEGMDPLPYQKEHPQFTFVISLNVVGQENTALGVVRQNMVMDDAIAKIWTQRLEVAGVTPEFLKFSVPRTR
ncbi:hypothetical protein D7I39_05085 [Allopusillimonas ginsengisoli]|nr:hypothetical protein D7I39_05085 [Allopusillimonas ginsengisoli]